jgi:hypothetical protein
MKHGSVVYIGIGNETLFVFQSNHCSKTLLGRRFQNGGFQNSVPMTNKLNMVTIPHKSNIRVDCHEDW